MKSLYLTYSLLLSLFLLSCGEEKQQLPSEQIVVEEAPKNQTLFVSNFTDLPSEIDGCSCIFSTDSLAYTKESYLYANDFGKVAFMKINGKITRLEEMQREEKDSLTTFTSYKAEGIEVDVTTSQGKQTGEESQEESGTITIRQEDGQTLTKTFYGQCGC